MTYLLASLAALSIALAISIIGRRFREREAQRYCERAEAMQREMACVADVKRKPAKVTPIARKRALKAKR